MTFSSAVRPIKPNFSLLIVPIREPSQFPARAGKF
jgi:hypothetical protein